MNIKAQLLELADPGYQAFTERLIPGHKNILGVRLPLLRKVAKEIAKENWREFLKQNDEVYFEEIMLKGMVIGYIKDASVNEIIKLIETFIPKMDNWSVCDSFCAGLKITKHHQEKFWPLICSSLSSEDEFEVRFGIVMMLTYYVDNRYVNDVLNHLEHLSHSGYYVRMAIAWAISACYVKYPNLTLAYLKETKLDTFTYHKALQKISESLKSDVTTKEMMKQMKRVDHC